MRENSSQLLLSLDPTNPDDARERSRLLAEEIVAVHLPQARTREAAIYSVERRYRFDSWLRRLLRGDRVVNHVHYWERLKAAFREANRIQEERIAAKKRIAAGLEQERPDERAGEALRAAPAAQGGERMVVRPNLRVVGEAQA